MLKYLLCTVVWVLTVDGVARTSTQQDSIIARYLERGAWKHSYFSKQWDQYIAAGLKEDSTIAYLWQQRGMPLLKQRKYEAAMAYIDKAVQYDSTWLAYRAVMKCIFAKTYRDALKDLIAVRKREGNVYQMDHSYNFYIALCQLQLNEYKEAFETLKADIDYVATRKGEDIVHHLDLFYLGIINYELGKYDDAIVALDRAIKKYPTFSDAKYYKALCLKAKGNQEQADDLIKEAKKDFQKGFTINEDNSFYEPYPYQVNWTMSRIK